jgi:hypothetical protein
MSSSGFGTVGGSVFVVFVLGGVLFFGGTCFGFGKLLKRTSVLPLLYPVLEGADEEKESEEADESVRDKASSFLLPRCWRTVSFYLVRLSELLCWAVGSGQIPHPNPIGF